MALVVRQTDPNICGGMVMAGSPTVRVNGLPVAVNNCPVTPHPNFRNPHVSGTTRAGQNTTVRAAGQLIVVSTDQDTCKHLRGTGSPNVRIGG